MAAHYTDKQRKAFVAKAVRIRESGGTWAEALQATRKLGFKGRVSYLEVLINRAHVYRSEMPPIPEAMQQRWREAYRLFVKDSAVETKRLDDLD